MEKILITALGTVTSASIVKMLLESDKKYILTGADINPANRIVTSKDVTEYYVFPSSVENSDDYLKYVLSFCEKHNVKYIFP